MEGKNYEAGLATDCAGAGYMVSIIIIIIITSVIILIRFESVATGQGCGPYLHAERVLYQGHLLHLQRGRDGQQDRPQHPVRCHQGRNRQHHRLHHRPPRLK